MSRGGIGHLPLQDWQTLAANCPTPFLYFRCPAPPRVPSRATDRRASMRLGQRVGAGPAGSAEGASGPAGGGRTTRPFDRVTLWGRQDRRRTLRLSRSRNRLRFGAPCSDGPPHGGSPFRVGGEGVPLGCDFFDSNAIQIEPSLRATIRNFVSDIAKPSRMHFGGVEILTSKRDSGLHPYNFCPPPTTHHSHQADFSLTQCEEPGWAGCIESVAAGRHMQRFGRVVDAFAKARQNGGNGGVGRGTQWGDDAHPFGRHGRGSRGGESAPMRRGQASVRLSCKINGQLGDPEPSLVTRGKCKWSMDPIPIGRGRKDFRAEEADGVTSR